jgi:predicted nucleotidyltransferase
MKPSATLDAHRDAIHRIVAEHRADNARAFGSVLRDEYRKDSNLDLLVDPRGSMTLFDLGAIRHELGQLLGVKVDVLTPGALPAAIRDRVVAEAQAV